MSHGFTGMTRKGKHRAPSGRRPRHAECLPKGTTINAVFRVEVMKRLHEADGKRPQKWKNWLLLHQDNMPCHISLSIQNFLVGKKNITVVPHLPYSPDLALCDFWLFHKLKKTTKQRWFDRIEDVKSNLLKRLTEDFQKCLTVAGMVEQVCLSGRVVLRRGLTM